MGYDKFFSCFRFFDKNGDAYTQGNSCFYTPQNHYTWKLTLFY